MLLQNRDLRGGTYNLGSWKSYRVKEIFALIEAFIGSGLTPHFLPELPGEADRTLADISGTLETGWQPVVTLERGLVDFIHYTKDRLAQEKREPCGSSLITT